MKFKFCYLILILVLFISCQSDQNLVGYYKMCLSGDYGEVYFKKDSMRFASDNEWVKLSDWKKIRIENDTLYFETFGEWRNSESAKITFHGGDEIELRILENNVNINLIRFDENPNFENLEEFWNGFHTRQDNQNCE